MVGECRARSAGAGPPGSRAGVTFNPCWKRFWWDRKSGCAIGRSGRLRFPARLAWISTLDVSPRPVHVAVDRYTALGNCSWYGGHYVSRFLRRVRDLAEHSPPAGTLVALCAKRIAITVQIVLNGSSRSKRLKPSVAVERSAQKLRRRRISLGVRLNSLNF
jgi:hypothetical protein